MAESIESAIEDVQEDVLVDLYETIINDFANVEQSLMDLHHHEEPQLSAEVIVGFLKNIEAISQQTFIEPYVAYIHAVEDVFMKTAKHQLPITESLSELLLLTIDQVRAVCEGLMHERYFDYQQLQELTQQLKRLNSASSAHINQVVVEAMHLFSSKVHPDLTFSASEVIEKNAQVNSELKSPREATVIPLQNMSLDVLQFDDIHHDVEPFIQQVALSKEQNQALTSFKDLGEAVEMRSKLWKGRTHKILYGCLVLNSHLPQHYRVDDLQLRAAVYMHDVYMSLLPDSILFKKGRYESTDIMLLQQHPIQAYEMLRLMPDWQEAAEMVHQHHERYDGQGYPHGMKGDEVLIGAQIIAVADAFYAITHERSDRKHYKSVVRATVELNKGRGTQFSPIVLDALNKAISTLIQERVEREPVAETA